ncbi:outer membrane beta-barrel protein [Microbulbifer sp. Q7]|uniref:outer membrane beta-barrel protein n=1 Tax=Microbulbifer sp. Q7 TaxID=1785091 RepID=UPI000831C4F3|nr:outer membrane beta-barrel protein [Microbulbifer sp. Q7]
MKRRFNSGKVAGHWKGKKITLHCGAVFLGLAGIAATAQAVTVDLPANFELIGSAGLEVQYDDNVSLTTQNRQDDWITRVSPSLELSREGQRTNLSTSFTVTRGHYLNGARENFTDYAADIAWQWRVGSLIEVRSTASYADVAQSVTGTLDGGLAPILVEAERTRRPSGEVSIAFGRQGGRLQSLIRHGIRKSEFDDAARDSTAVYSGATGSFELNSMLLVGIEAVQTNLDYVELTQIPRRDSNEVLVMATTEVRLPKTTIQLRGGRLHRDFTLDTRPDFEGPRWDGRISWSPKTYSTISFAIGENVQESLGFASFVDVKSSVFSWTHQWGETLSSTFSHSETAGEFVGTERSDRVTRSSLSVGYLPLDWLSVRLGMSSLDSSTSINALGLENNRYFLGLEAPL